MRNPSLVLMCWMVAAMAIVGGGVSWDWPFWVLGLVGVGFVGAAVLMSESNWGQTRMKQEEVISGIRQLHELSGVTETSAPLVVEPDSVGIHIQRIVAEVNKRMISLEEERKRIIAIMENLVEGVVAFDPNGRVLFTNPSAHRILGFDAYASQGRSVWEIIRNLELAALVESEIDDPRVDMVNVTHVRVSGDMRHARVYVSTQGNRGASKTALEGLDSAKGFLRIQLSQRLPHLKRTPELTFSYDESVEKEMRIEELLAELRSEER